MSDQEHALDVAVSALQEIADSAHGPIAAIAQRALDEIQRGPAELDVGAGYEHIQRMRGDWRNLIDTHG